MMATSAVRIALAQINPRVGDIDANADLIIADMKRAHQEFNADIVLFPELSLTGYPPEDLLFRSQFVGQVESAIVKINHANPGVCAIFGAIKASSEGLQNVAVISRQNKDVSYYTKQKLPNYGVFDEQRYFVKGDEECVITVKNVKFGITVCEDIWFPEPAKKSVEAGAQVLLNLNASPFHVDKVSDRIAQVRQRIAENKVPICYCNLVGGQDELVFDGQSFAMDHSGNLIAQASGFQSDLSVVEYSLDKGLKAVSKPAEIKNNTDQVYQALVLATRDYVVKNGFKKVILGLSGGIDSALVLAIAVDALGAEAVQAVMMPYHYTSDMSRADAADQADRLGVHYSILPIAGPVEAFQQVLADEFAGLAKDVTEENLQSRSRGILLMALSNKKGAMLLTTGNKSEMAVGYATLYGDMAGGYAPLKDVSKLMVYELARFRNQQSEVIPKRVIERPPSAELAPDQVDQDSLPAYDILDPILEMYIEQEISVAEIIARGYDRKDVERVAWLVDLSEYKRRQSPPGVRITSKAFGKERRYPITSGFKRVD